MPTIHRRVGEGVNHPTQKPLKLCAKFVHASSNVGDVVFDPFCGSGTTLLAAKLLDRKFWVLRLIQNIISYQKEEWINTLKKI